MPFNKQGSVSRRVESQSAGHLWAQSRIRAHHKALIPISFQFSAEGKLLGTGRNKRIQEGSPTKHGEIDCLENVGVSLGLSAISGYTRTTAYPPTVPAFISVGLQGLHVSTRPLPGRLWHPIEAVLVGCTPHSHPAQCVLAPVRHIVLPSQLCCLLSVASTVILFGIRRVVLGENTTFVGEPNQSTRSSLS